jgi:hypothetical protein
MKLIPSWETASCLATQEFPNNFWNSNVHYCALRRSLVGVELSASRPGRYTPWKRPGTWSLKLFRNQSWKVRERGGFDMLIQASNVVLQNGNALLDNVFILLCRNRLYDCTVLATCLLGA